MTSLFRDNINLLRNKIDKHIQPADALPDSVGGLEMCDGLWRFFSHIWPDRGIRSWNETSRWRTSWDGVLPAGLYSFGEDVFGNQLVLLPQHKQVFLWNHENGECHDLLVAPVELLETGFESGLEWIDFYGDGSLSVARRYGHVSRDSHLHWVTPLILGGKIDLDNIAPVEREAHLVGHAKLWLEVSGLAPGTAMVPR